MEFHTYGLLVQTPGKPARAMRRALLALLAQQTHQLAGIDLLLVRLDVDCDLPEAGQEWHGTWLREARNGRDAAAWGTSRKPNSSEATFIRQRSTSSHVSHYGAKNQFHLCCAKREAAKNAVQAGNPACHSHHQPMPWAMLSANQRKS